MKQEEEEEEHKSGECVGRRGAGVTTRREHVLSRPFRIDDLLSCFSGLSINFFNKNGMC